MNLHKNHVSSIFGHFRAVYINNKNYFVNELMNNYYKNCKITHYIRLISHLLSTRLLERLIQGLITFSRIKYIECRTTDAWSFYIQEKVLFSNTKNAKINGYIPAEICLASLLNCLL